MGLAVMPLYKYFEDLAKSWEAGRELSATPASKANQQLDQLALHAKHSGHEQGMSVDATDSGPNRIETTGDRY